MTQGNDFLIRYGIHNFVTYQEQKNAPVFSIRKSVHHKMVAHAKKLIQGAYGEATDIRFC